MYSFYIDGVQLPIAPAKLNIKIKNQNRTITLINDGEVNILKTAGLTEITFDARLPQVRYPFAIYPNGFRSADFFLNKFEILKQSGEPFQFVVSRVSQNGNLLFDTNMRVAIEDYDIEESAAEGLDVIVSIKLKQYKNFGKKTPIIKTTQSKTTLSVENKRTVTKPIPKTYTVQPGDSLWKICQKELGNGSKYSDIASLNGLANASLIYPGQVIRFG
jgi:nucleoid-associated protein YgaU